jgi:hypothetical protein
MISVEKFNLFVYKQLLEPLKIQSTGFNPRYSTKLKDFNVLHSLTASASTCGRCIWWHEEPLNYKDLDAVRYIGAIDLVEHDYAEWATNLAIWTDCCNISPTQPSVPPVANCVGDVNLHLFANSEHSTKKRKYLREWNVQDWYFFFHGFAALDWFSDFKYFDSSQQKPSKLFICLNHLIADNRSYRLYLLSLLKQKRLQESGHISAPLLTPHTIKQELGNVTSRLPREAKKHIFKNLYPDASPLVLDHCNYNDASADISNESIDALWHVVPETVYYDDSLHLTEKIFKPIAIRRPFILVGAPGNLAYLKSYGFRTFSQWIDESYDQEQDPTLRINMIVEQLSKLKNKDIVQQQEQMQEVLEYNHQHFYGKFKEIIVDELLGNFKKQVNWYNHDRIERHRLPSDVINYEQVRNLMLS